MKKKVFSISVPVWVTYNIKADDLEAAIAQAKFNINMNRKGGRLLEPHWDLMRYFEKDGGKA